MTPAQQQQQRALAIMSRLGVNPAPWNIVVESMAADCSQPPWFAAATLAYAIQGQPRAIRDLRDSFSLDLARPQKEGTWRNRIRRHLISEGVNIHANL